MTSLRAFLLWVSFSDFLRCWMTGQSDTQLSVNTVSRKYFFKFTFCFTCSFNTHNFLPWVQIWVQLDDAQPLKPVLLRPSSSDLTEAELVPQPLKGVQVHQHTHGTPADPDSMPRRSGNFCVITGKFNMLLLEAHGTFAIIKQTQTILLIKVLF